MRSIPLARHAILEDLDLLRGSVVDFLTNVDAKKRLLEQLLQEEEEEEKASECRGAIGNCPQKEGDHVSGRAAQPETRVEIRSHASPVSASGNASASHPKKETADFRDFLDAVGAMGQSLKLFQGMMDKLISRHFYFRGENSLGFLLRHDVGQKIRSFRPVCAETLDKALAVLGSGERDWLGDLALLLRCGANLNDLVDTRPLLSRAVMSQRKEGLEMLIRFGADVNRKGSDGSSSLALACHRDEWEIAKILLEAGAHAESGLMGSLRMPLHMAASAGRWGLVKSLLVKGGADLEALNERRDTPLSIAVSQEATRLREGRTESEERNFFKFAQTLLSLGANPNTRIGGDETSDSALNTTVLHKAAGLGLVRFVELLVSSGADRTARDSTQRTPWEIVENAATLDQEVRASVLLLLQ
uniref:Uncharacterized protein n=1 Tax=Chromera velia CCMP2878 TaxID=1169474 RepID=A0A0G4FYA1_9ALVE|eukprot:Cvel_19374.t1-p1 / transcript=Cvel_19374.t1 / gene=Cvel_19374 / organism=Chromera_velia_CCMP2878 / gene_product=Ankyrin repeat and SOCS box protein 13, putative / transcript_product=Ankyrin repeat and SOCS box protein 13, putative / location=Cvel_scaffold1665:33501-39859(+) / protein_length=415 / sequence_SO=supercontig / SO=protein_coding / is_pseudo=false